MARRPGQHGQDRPEHPLPGRQQHDTAHGPGHQQTRRKRDHDDLNDSSGPQEEPSFVGIRGSVDREVPGFGVEREARRNNRPPDARNNERRPVIARLLDPVGRPYGRRHHRQCTTPKRDQAQRVGDERGKKASGPDQPRRYQKDRFHRFAEFSDAGSEKAAGHEHHSEPDSPQDPRPCPFDLIHRLRFHGRRS